MKWKTSLCDESVRNAGQFAPFFSCFGSNTTSLSFATASQTPKLQCVLRLSSTQSIPPISGKCPPTFAHDREMRHGTRVPTSRITSPVHGEKGRQHSCPVPDILLLASLRLARFDQLRGVFHSKIACPSSRHCKPAVALVHTDAEPSRKLTGFPRLALKIGVVTVQPVDALVRFPIGIVENPKNRRSAHGLGMGLIEEGRRDVVQTPSRGRATVIRRLAGSDETTSTHKGGNFPRRTRQRSVLQSREAISLKERSRRERRGEAVAQFRISDFLGNQGRWPARPPGREMQMPGASKLHGSASSVVLEPLASLDNHGSGRKGWALVGVSLLYHSALAVKPPSPPGSPYIFMPSTVFLLQLCKMDISMIVGIYLSGYKVNPASDHSAHGIRRLPENSP